MGADVSRRHEMNLATISVSASILVKSDPAILHLFESPILMKCRSTGGSNMESGPSITDWMQALSGIVSAAGVVGGILVAWCQLNSWRNQSLVQRRSELAENILSAAKEIDDVMRNVRSLFGSGVPEDKRADKYFILNEKLRRLNDNSAAFQFLRKSQVKAKFIIQDTAVDAAIEQLFQARVDFLEAIDSVATYRDNPPQSDESKKLLNESERDMYGTYSDRDRINRSIQDALIKLEVRLGPTVRLNDRN